MMIDRQRLLAAWKKTEFHLMELANAPSAEKRRLCDSYDGMPPIELITGRTAYDNHMIDRIRTARDFINILLNEDLYKPVLELAKLEPELGVQDVQNVLAVTEVAENRAYIDAFDALVVLFKICEKAVNTNLVTDNPELWEKLQANPWVMKNLNHVSEGIADAIEEVKKREIIAIPNADESYRCVVGQDYYIT